MAGTRRARHSIIILFYVVVIVAKSCGFQAPPCVVPNGCKAWRCCYLELGQPRLRSAMKIRQRPGLRDEFGRSFRTGKGYLLSSPGDGSGGGKRIAEEQRKDGAVPDGSIRSRRYMGGCEDAGDMSNDAGAGEPRRSEDAQKWTVELCSKRLSLLHRKLRQVKDLLAKQAREPGSLDDAQLVKIGRKENLRAEIAELEALRKDLWKAEQEVAATKGVASTSRGRSRLPPGPFSGGMLAGEDNTAANQGRSDAREVLFGEEIFQDRAAGSVARELEADRYTADGLKLALPRRRRTTARSPSASPNFPPDEAFVPSAHGVSGGEEGEVFDREQDFNDQEVQVPELDPILEQAAVSGGYPKRLAGLMAFCRVSDKDTCEILVAMGRVTVNGVVVRDPGIKVDVMTDIIVANGEAVTLPPKINNADETRPPRFDEGKRTGPIPKSEKNTWKAKTKYRWNMDDGLLASRTRRVSNSKRRGPRGGRREEADW